MAEAKMTDGKRLLVQSLLSRRMLPYEEAVKVCGSALQHFEGEPMFHREEAPSYCPHYTQS